MSFNPFNAPLSLKIKPSIQKWLIILVPHLLAILLLSNVGDLPFLLKLALIIGILVSMVFFSRLHLFQSLKHSVLSIRQDSVKNWFVLTAGESELKAVTLMPSSFVSNHFIILNYTLQNPKYLSQKFSVLITKDSLAVDDFRVLRARLKMSHMT